MKAKTNKIEFNFDNNKKFVNSLLCGFENKKIILKYFAPKSKYLKSNNEKIDYSKLNKALKKEIGHTLYSININSENIEYFTFSNNNDNYKEIDFENLNEFKYSEIIKMIFKRILYENFIKNNSKNEFLQKDNDLIFYVDHIVKTKEIIFELLKLDLNFDIKRKTLNIILNKDKILCDIKNIDNLSFSKTNEEFNDLILLNKDYIEKIKIINLDARKSKINFMDFQQNVKKTILYKINEIMNQYEYYFNKNNISYKNDYFEHNLLKNINLNNELNINNDILIINLKQNNLNENEMKLLNIVFLEKNYKISFFKSGIRAFSIDDYNNLKLIKNVNFLFLSDENLKYEEHKEKIKENLNFDEEDFYTYFKYNNLIFFNNNISSQNIIGNILEKGNIIDYDKKIDNLLINYQLEKNEFKLNEKINLGNEKITYKISDKFQIVLKEISIKEFLIYNKQIDLNNIFNGNFKLIYYYRKQNKNNQNKEFKIFIDININNGLLEIEKFGEIQLRDWSKIKNMFNYYTKKDEQIIIDGSFIVLDKNTEDYLMYYTNSKYIPQIIGNLNFDFIENVNNQLNKNNKIKRVSKGDNVLIPYYLMQSSKKIEENREKIYIENKNYYFQYFIPTLNNTNITINKASRIYFGFIKNKNNEIIKDYQNNTLYELFFSTFSSGIVKKDNTKINLLEKLIRTLIFN